MVEYLKIPGTRLPWWAEQKYEAGETSFVLENLANEDYHGAKGMVSKSNLDIAARSGAHYRHFLNPKLSPGYIPGTEVAPEEPTEPMIVGNAFHTLILEPLAFARRYVVMPDFGDMRSSTRRATRDTWIAEEARGKTPLTKAQDSMIRAMRESALRVPKLRAILDRGRAEVTASCICPHTGLPQRSRTDWVSDIMGLGFDLKSAVDASERYWRIEAGRRRLAVQDAMYTNVFGACGIPFSEFVFGVIEKEPPFAVGLYTLSDEDRACGEQLYLRGLRNIQRWVEADDFPGYTPEGVRTITLPKYAREEAEAALNDLEN